MVSMGGGGGGGHLVEQLGKIYNCQGNYRTVGENINCEPAHARVQVGSQDYRTGRSDLFSARADCESSIQLLGTKFGWSSIESLSISRLSLACVIYTRLASYKLRVVSIR